MKKTLNSILAVLAGFLFIGITHTGTDAIFESLGVLPKGNLHVATSLVIFVLGYRTFFSLIGSYLTARLAPQNPLKHALILGAIGTILSLGGALASANMNLGPAWYGWSLVVISLPVSWLGGKFYIAQTKTQ